MNARVVLAALVCALLAGCEGSSWRDPVSRKVDKGNELFARGQVNDALDAYRDAQIDAPEDAQVHFNIGDALYRQRKYDDAEQAYTTAAAKGDELLRAQAAYNVGNVQFRRQELDKAAESFQRALELNPDDMDAKFNLELVQRLLNQAAQNATAQRHSERPNVSEWAQRRAREAEALAQQGRYAEADQIMQRTIRAEPATAAAFGDFAERLHDLAGIFGGGR